MKFPRLVDNAFLVDVALELLIVEIYDELVAKGWAVRDDLANEEASIEWTELGRHHVHADTEMAFMVEELRLKVLGLKARRIRGDKWLADLVAGDRLIRSGA